MEIKAKEITFVDIDSIHSQKPQKKSRQYDIDRRSNLLNKMINSRFGRLTVVSLYYRASKGYL